MKPSAIRIERMLEKIEAVLVPPPRKVLSIVTHEGEDDEAVAMEKTLAEHVACHPEDAGRTVEDFRWIVNEIVQWPRPNPIPLLKSQRQKSQRPRREMKLPRANPKTSLKVFRSMGARAPMALPRRPSPLICRRLTLVSSLAQSHGAPCINVLLGISADRRGRNGNDDPARTR
jgi:hypothetical protein